MVLRFLKDQGRLLVIVAGAGLLHLLVLCAPIVLVPEGYRNATDPKMVTFLFVVSVWCFLESMIGAATPRFPTRSEGPRHLPLAIGLSLLVTFWVSLIDTALSGTGSFGAAAAAGTVCMATGIALRYLSLRTLGPFFRNEVVIMPDQPLVTHGIYGSLRHPSETGTLCLAYGGPIVLGSVSGLIVSSLLVLPCLIWRTHLEDRMLRNHYATEFNRYAREVPAFLPRIRFTRPRH